MFVSCLRPLCTSCYCHFKPQNKTTQAIKITRDLPIGGYAIEVQIHCQTGNVIVSSESKLISDPPSGRCTCDDHKYNESTLSISWHHSTMSWHTVILCRNQQGSSVDLYSPVSPWPLSPHPRCLSPSPPLPVTEHKRSGEGSTKVSQNMRHVEMSLLCILHAKSLHAKYYSKTSSLHSVYRRSCCWLFATELVQRKITILHQLVRMLITTW